MDENTDVKVARCNGAAECKKALLLMKVGKLPEDFVEGMACVGGCVAVPAGIKLRPSQEGQGTADWVCRGEACAGESEEVSYG